MQRYRTRRVELEENALQEVPGLSLAALRLLESEVRRKRAAWMGYAPMATPMATPIISAKGEIPYMHMYMYSYENQNRK